MKDKTDADREREQANEAGTRGHSPRVRKLADQPDDTEGHRYVPIDERPPVGETPAVAPPPSDGESTDAQPS